MKRKEKNTMTMSMTILTRHRQIMQTCNDTYHCSRIRREGLNVNLKDVKDQRAP